MKNFLEYLKDSVNEFSSHLALISAYKEGRDNRINRLLDEQLGKDIEKMGWKCERVNGEWKGVKEKSYLVNAQAVSEESFIDTILAWINKYEQEAAFIRYAHSDTKWLLTSSGNKYKEGSWSW